MGAATRGMLFLQGGTIARTHGALLVAAALADTDAAKGGLIEASAVLQVVEVRNRLDGAIVGAEAQVFIDAVGIDDFARIHFPFRIPESFEFAKGLDQFFAVHLV